MDKNPEAITQENVKRTYQRYAPIYNFLFGRVLEPGRKALLHEVSQLNPKTILEIGVGTGLLLRRYPMQSSVTGIDISEDMLQIARDSVHQLNRDITLLQMDAENLSFDNASFDCVVLPYVLSVTPSPAKLVEEARRVCKPYGMIILVNHFSGSGYWLLLEKMFKPFAKKIGFRSEFSFERQIIMHDWSIVKVRTVNFLGLSKLVVIKNIGL